MGKPTTLKTKCRFCDSEPMALRALRNHVAKKHPDEAARIQGSLSAAPQIDRMGGFGRAGLNDEFRRRMGYQRKDGNGPNEADE